MPVLDAIGLGVALFAVAGCLTGRVSSARIDFLFGVANGLYALQGVRGGHWLGAVISGAFSAYCFYAWWHGGGGDHTRRRLRQLRRRFEGVRRTAPATA